MAAKMFLCGIFTVFFISFASSGKAGLTCNVNNLISDVEATLMTCTIENMDPGLMLKIIENMKHPEKLISVEFMCGYQPEMAKLANCMLHKLSQCAPPQIRKSLPLVFPDEKRWREVLKMLCDNRKLLTSPTCMSRDNSNGLLQCYTAKAAGLLPRLMAYKASDPIQDNPFCLVRRWEEECVAANTDACPKDYVQGLLDTIEIITKIPGCPKATALDSLLLQGRPLKWQSEIHGKKAALN